MSLQPFTEVSGQAAPLLAANVDTDVIMPKQFLKGIDRQGLDRGLFFDLRFLADGTPNPEFVLNQPAWQGASFLGASDDCGPGGATCFLPGAVPGGSARRAWPIHTPPSTVRRSSAPSRPVRRWAKTARSSKA